MQFGQKHGFLKTELFRSMVSIETKNQLLDHYDDLDRQKPRPALRSELPSKLHPLSVEFTLATGAYTWRQ